MNAKDPGPGKQKKERLPRQPMPEQPPRERIKNFREVPLGYTVEQAMAEASRCLRCKSLAACLAALWRWTYPASSP
jgi:hypothetical protein